MNLIKKTIIFCLAIFIFMAAFSVAFYLALITAFVFLCFFLFYKLKKSYSQKSDKTFDNHDLKSMLESFAEKYSIVAYDRQHSSVVFCNNKKFLNDISHYVYTHSSVNLIKLVAENNIENLHITHKVFAGVDVYLKPKSEYKKLYEAFDSFPLPVFVSSSDQVTYRNKIAKNSFSDAELLRLQSSEKQQFLKIGHLTAYMYLDDKNDCIRSFISHLPFTSCLINEGGEVLEFSSLNKVVSLQKGENFISKLDRESAGKLQDYLNSSNENQLVLNCNFNGQETKWLNLAIVRYQGVLLVQLFDLTKYHKIEEDFVHSQKMQAVGQLAGGIAHDFNNLLTAIIGFCDLLLIRHTPGDPSFADIMQIKQNAGRSASLVKQILDVSRKRSFNADYINVSDTLLSLSDLIRRLVGVDISFEIDREKNLNYALTNQSQFEQIIINFIVNARDAVLEKKPEEGGRINLHACNIVVEESKEFDFCPISQKDEDVEVSPGQYISIEIEDNGTGINKETLEKMFDPYFSTKNIGQGTGLGLSMVYELINKVGGYLSVKTEIGQGTKFTILFKAEKAEKFIKNSKPEESLIASDITGNETILLIEDEDPIRLFASHALENKGYNVLHASSAEEGIDVIKQHNAQIDLIITDVVMPGMDGTMLLKIMKDMGWDIKVVFISGYTLENLSFDALENNKVDFLPKPFNLKDLVIKVRSALDEPKSP